MPNSMGTLHLIAGKIAAGKSTLAARLSAGPSVVVIAEDQWLGALYGPEMETVQDYVRYSARLRDVIGPHIVAILRAGMTVVLDYPANTVEMRAWMRGLIEEASCAHQLHFLDVADDLCKARLQARNAAGTHEFAASDAEFDLITRHFVPPAESEGFTIVRHEA